MGCGYDAAGRGAAAQHAQPPCPGWPPPRPPAHAAPQVWGPSGKRRPPAGRWVSTGKEALKFGLNIPGVAESYDEGGNLVTARWAKGLAPGEELPG